MKYFLIFIPFWFGFWVKHSFCEELNYKTVPNDVRKMFSTSLSCKDLSSLGRTSRENVVELYQNKRYQLSKKIIKLFRNIVSLPSENIPSFVLKSPHSFALVKKEEKSEDKIVQMREMSPQNLMNDIKQEKIFVRHSFVKSFPFKNMDASGRKYKWGSRKVTYKKDLKVWWDEEKDILKSEEYAEEKYQEISSEKNSDHFGQPCAITFPPY